MPQNGLHGLVGLAVARRVRQGAGPDAAIAFATGITLGAMLPDIDLYPTAVVFLLGRPDLIYAVHRTLTHSLLAVLILAAAGMTLENRTAALCRGLALGMLTHLFLDIFFWFSPIDLFWPLSHIPAGHPLLPVIDLWARVKLPPVFGNPDFVGNFLGACEYAAFALYLGALARRIGPENSSEARRLECWRRWAWVLFVITAAGAVALNGNQQQILVMVPYLAIFLPVCWWETIRLRASIFRETDCEKGYTRANSNDR